MQVLRLNEVLTRVVAWYNRHPLARRVQASQVHSIGEVLLPFASARPGAEAAAAVASPMAAAAVDLPRTGGSLADVVSARAAARPAALALPALPGLEVHTASPEVADAVPESAEAADFDPFAPSPSVATGTEDGAEATPSAAEPATLPPDEQAPDPAAEPDTDASAEANPEPASAPETEPTDETDPAPASDNTAAAETADLPTDADPAASPDDALTFSATAADEAAFAPDPADPSTGRPDTDLSPAPEPGTPPMASPVAPVVAPTWATEAPVGWCRRLWARLTGRRPGWPRLEAAFSRDFIWPLTPRQVARWAQRHGQPRSLAPADWPRRQVAPDPARLGQLRQAGLSHTVHLHLLTAAVGVGDRRIRVLMDADGHILGPRAYSKPRVASAAGLLLAGLLGAGWPWGGLGPARPAEPLSLAAQAASAAAAASQAAIASAAATAATASEAASAASATTAADPALAAPVARAPVPAAAASTAPDGRVAARAMTPSKTIAPIDPPVPAVAAATVDATAANATTPDAAAATGHSATLGRIRPALSDDDKRLARQQAAQLRAVPGTSTTAVATTANTAPAPVYAVVTPPTRDRQAAANGLALMRSAGARLTPPAPDHGELMQSQGHWRAAWWPFASQADAERARVMLVSRGLKAEVIEF